MALAGRGQTADCHSTPTKSPLPPNTPTQTVNSYQSIIGMLSQCDKAIEAQTSRAVLSRIFARIIPSKARRCTLTWFSDVMSGLRWTKAARREFDSLQQNCALALVIKKQKDV